MKNLSTLLLLIASSLIILGFIAYIFYCKKLNSNNESQEIDEDQKKKKEKQSMIGCSWLLLTIVSFVFIIFSLFTYDYSNRDKVENDTSNNNSVWQVEEYIKSNLKTNDTYRWESWGKVLKRDDGYYTVRYIYHLNDKLIDSMFSIGLDGKVFNEDKKIYDGTELNNKEYETIKEIY